MTDFDSKSVKRNHLLRLWHIFWNHSICLKAGPHIKTRHDQCCRNCGLSLQRPQIYKNAGGCGTWNSPWNEFGPQKELQFSKAKTSRSNLDSSRLECVSWVTQICKSPEIDTYKNSNVPWSTLRIGIFPVDQLFSDKGKLRYNESSLVGQIVVICLRGLLIKLWIKTNICWDRLKIRCTNHLCCHKIAGQVETFLS